MTDAEGFPGNLVRFLVEDREGNLWIGMNARLRNGSMPDSLQEATRWRESGAPDPSAPAAGGDGCVGHKVLHHINLCGVRPAS